MQEDFYHPKRVGRMLKLARLKSNKQLKEVALSHCAISTLSKIESGRQRAHPDLLIHLYRELSITYHTDPQSLLRWRQTMEAFWRCDAYWRPFDLSVLWQSTSAIEASPLSLEWLLIRYHEEKDEEQREQMKGLLKQLEDVLSDTEKGRFYHARSPFDPEDAQSVQEEAFKLLKTAHAGIGYLESLYRLGSFRRLLEESQSVLELALKEGNTAALAKMYFLRGTVYASLDQIEGMIQEYTRSQNLLWGTPWQRLNESIEYNLGATYLSLGDLALAQEHLSKIIERSPIVWHKLALLYHRLGETKKAQQALDSFAKSHEGEDRITVLLERSARMEFSGTLMTLEGIALLEEMMALFQRLGRIGSFIFYREPLKEAYKVHRMYKKALALEEAFAAIPDRGLSPN
ncbi:hypothetical protein ABB02_00941 [Clostridiaceae bacterium JG1575]|nr:hypothetical protein ABB02_00941 [Clostridiaceae bacterium JG1575]